MTEMNAQITIVEAAKAREQAEAEIKMILDALREKTELETHSIELTHVKTTRFVRGRPEYALAGVNINLDSI